MPVIEEKIEAFETHRDRIFEDKCRRELLGIETKDANDASGTVVSSAQSNTKETTHGHVVVEKN